MARKKTTVDDAVVDAERQLDGEDEGGGASASNRAETIREACETIAEYERQVDALKAEIKLVKETRIKVGLGMKIKEFNLAYKLHQLGTDERDSLFDTIRECFDALGVGTQLDWVSAVEADGRGG